MYKEGTTDEMLSQELRPFDFSEMAGQEENINILKAVIRNPEKAPKCLIFAGAFGSGKTTSARILARALNNITDRDFDLVNSRFYYEYDSTVIGNVETIRNLREQFLVQYGDYWKVIILDECHAISNMAQNALLKVFEEVDGKIIFIMCTTEPNKLLPTIRSRSLELEFKPVPMESIVQNLNTVEQKLGITLTDDLKLLIADRSAGHMRNAHMLLDKYLLLGEEDFKDSIKSAISLYCEYLIAIKQRDKDKVLRTLNDLLNIPREDLQSDWNTILTESMRGFAGFDVRHNDIKKMLDFYGKDFELVLNTCYFTQWIKSAFIDMPYFQASFLNLYIVLTQAFNAKEAREQQNNQPQVQANPYGSALVRR